MKQAHLQPDLRVCFHTIFGIFLFDTENRIFLHNAKIRILSHNTKIRMRIYALCYSLVAIARQQPS